MFRHSHIKYSNRGETSTFRKLFTLLIIIFPALFLYYSGLSSLSVADVLLISCHLFFLFDLIKNNKIILFNKIWIVYLLYLIFNYMILLFYIGSNDFYKFLRYFLYVSTLVFLVPVYYDFRFGIKAIKVFGVSVAIFTILQAVFLHLFGFYIKGYLPFLPIMREELINYGDTVGTYFRVRGIFGEPAHLGTYLSLVLIGILLGEEKKDHICAIIVTIAMLFSGSNTAYILIVVIWGGSIILNIKQINHVNSKGVIKIIGVGILFLIIIYFFTQSNLYTLATRRYDASYSGRMDGYSIFFDNNYTPFEKLFGHGYVTSTSYLPSYPLIYFRYGYLGLYLILFMLILTVVKYRSAFQLMCLFSLIILSAGTEVFNSYNIMYFMAGVFTHCNKNVDNTPADKK